MEGGNSHILSGRFELSLKSKLDNFTEMIANFIDLVKFHLELSILFEDLRRSQGYRITLESLLFPDVSSYISFSSYTEGKQPVLES